MSRRYVYEQKERAKEHIEAIENEEEGVTERQLKRIIIGAALYCRSTLEGIQDFCREVFEIKVSIGYISKQLTEAAERAQEFDDSIELSKILQGANDEIFQKNQPILTGIDLMSTYIYLLEGVFDRSGLTWQMYMEDRKEHGLNLEVTVNDGGSGLKSGIPKAFPEVTIQADVFHAIYEVGKEVLKIERKTYASIKEEYELEKGIKSSRVHKKTETKYELIRPKVKKDIEVYDKIYIMYGWLKELLGFSGYSYEETNNLIGFVIDEIRSIAKSHTGLLNQLDKLEKNLPSLLVYIKRLEAEFHKRSEINKIPENALFLMYHQMAFNIKSIEYNNLEYKIVKILNKDYDKTREIFFNVFKGIKKASSLVENLNSRIRNYINIKRVVPDKFFVLMKVFFNTHHYHRSRCLERVGKSPIELLTGKEYPEILDILGY